MAGFKTLILTAFVLVLGAGVVAGRLWARLPNTAATAEGKSPNWLVDQLNLTAEQRQEMDAIWADTKQKLDQKMEHRRTLDHERDQAIADLLGPEQWAVYGRLVDEFRQKRAEVDKERFALVHDANDRSRALLSDEQKQQWDQIRQNRHDHDGHGGGGGDWRRMHGGSATRPATNPADGVH